jgi:hypothetical protein
MLFTKYYKGDHMKEGERWAGCVACVGEMRNVYILFGQPEGKRSLGRSRRRWEDNIRTDFRKIGWECVYWMRTAQDRDQWRVLVKTVMNLRVGNLLTG